jgi:hypothetical protein
VKPLNYPENTEHRCSFCKGHMHKGGYETDGGYMCSGCMWQMDNTGIDPHLYLNFTEERLAKLCPECLKALGIGFRKGYDQGNRQVTRACQSD